MLNPDSTLLSWITAEVSQALTVVREQMAKFGADPQNGALLQPCPGHMHQVSGALRMVGLAGATRFCEAIEAGFSGLNGALPDAATIAVLDRSVLALKEFVEGLERGQPNQPLALYPVYRELSALHGKSAGGEKDLFYPDLGIAAPAHPSPAAAPKEGIAPTVQASRALFQRGVLAWLRNTPSGLDDMTRAVQTLHQLAAHLPEPRALWWAALGVLEALRETKDAEWLLLAKPLLNRIDFHMRDLAAGAAPVNEALLRELLYALGKSSAPAPRAKEIRALYQLDTLFPAARAERGGASLGLNTEFLEAALYDLHSRLEAVKSSWVQYISGEQKAAVRFRELVASFRTKAAELGSHHLIKLLDAIGLVTKQLPDPYPRQKQYMVIEMASAFLLVESVIDQFGNPPEDIEQQIVIMGGWLLDSAKGKSTNEPPAGLRADLVQKVGGLQLRAQVAREALSNLQHIEQVLDSFSRDASKREGLDGLGAYLRQVHGALKVLAFERAAEAVAICENMIAACSVAAPDQAAEGMDWVAEGLSSVGLYLSPCVQGREPSDQALDLFFQRFSRRVEAVDTHVEADVTIKLEDAGRRPEPAAPAPRPEVDAELLAIFLEEAAEVLQRIEATLPVCRKQPDDLESLTTIRRGFHTLKGSGRMVGLMDLGEVAWEIEQLMNLWLEEKRLARPALLDLLAAACGSFSAWLHELGQGTLRGEIQADELVEAARALKSSSTSGGSTETATAAPAPVEPTVIDLDFAVAAPAEPTVTIGTTTLTQAMFEIYLKEAADHVEALEAGFAEWRATPGADTPQSFMRAAHTLASSSSTAGFSQIADLAGAVEQWLPFARHTTEAADVRLIQDAIARLRAMTQAMARHEAPVRSADHTGRLKALTARLEWTPAPAAAATAAAATAATPQNAPARKADPQSDDADKDKRALHDDLDEALLPVFLEEAQELVPAIGADLRDWKANPANDNVSQSLRRGLHTLKGSARMAGAIRLGELTHLMESRIEAAIEANAFPTELFAELEERMDRLSADVERMRAGPAEPEAPAGAHGRDQTKVAEAAPLQPAAMLRVNADTLDHLINEAGEVAIARSRVEAELRLIRQTLHDLSESVGRMRGQLREVEIQADSQVQSQLSVQEDHKKSDYDPLEFDRYTRLQELTRLMVESLSDIASIQAALGKNLGETDAALLAQTRTTREVQQQLMRMRAVPFATLNERLYRVVRQTARDVEKKAELEIEGAEVELDRSVLERISAPIEHMLRNALAHGVESPATRVKAGKPEAGRIVLTLRQEANEIALVLSDDGGGLDLERLHQKAIEKSIVSATQQLSDAEKAQLIFASGLSTAEAVTELAGRGVGMDVVRNEIATIGGRIDISTARGQGTSFTVYLPLTLAVTQAVLIRSGGGLFALSTAMVEQVLRVRSDEMAGLYATKRVEFQGRNYPLHSLAHMFGGSVSTELQNYNSVLLLRSGIQRVALHVDELMGNQEIVVKSLGPQLARMAWVSGATVLPDGSIVPLINPVVLARRTLSGVPDFEHTTLVPHLPGRGKKAATVAPIVMVVDDSLTVRKITTRLLEREGYQVVTAKDGLEALEQMRETLPAIMLVDIEMPRMDGFDLTRNVRGDPRTKDIPIIMISSRTAEKHRSQAAALGVNQFLGKPYQEAELLAQIAAFLGTTVG
jgi:chemosensory pili system protein ChpA (sensor histidine kinase/response regulator)